MPVVSHTLFWVNTDTVEICFYIICKPERHVRILKKGTLFISCLLPGPTAHEQRKQERSRPPLSPGMGLELELWRMDRKYVQCIAKNQSCPLQERPIVTQRKTWKERPSNQ